MRFLNLGRALLFTGAALAITTAAVAADISGAGATFPYPVYSKWADAYKKADRHRSQLSVDRLGRRHQADQGEDGDVRRFRHAAEAG